MNIPDESTLARWLDGTLSADENAAFGALLERDPALRGELEALRSGTEDDDITGHFKAGPAVVSDFELRCLIKEHVVLERPVPREEDFRTQILERIASQR